MEQMANLMLIGFGPHAQRIYFPIYQKDGKRKGFKIVHGVDLLEKMNDIENYFSEKGERIEMTYLTKKQRRYDSFLDDGLEKELDKIIKEKNIKGVIIATEPLAHKAYCLWVLSRGLNILMDKPLSIAEGLSVDERAVERIKSDYEEIAYAYEVAKRKKPNLVFSLMAQRRCHPAFIKMKELIGDVFDRTNCPITSTQSFHGDGQWRFPTEIVEQDYHPYNQGYGKCSHSGYHSIDIVPWLIRGAYNKEKYIDNADIVSSFIYPKDFIRQLTSEDYKNLFPNYNKYNKFEDNDFIKVTKGFGELDAFNLITFKQDGLSRTVSSINLAHNGCSQRNWVTANGRDLYKGNGRVRHESHYFEQGPFQSILFESYQSKEVDLSEDENRLYQFGGEYHLDIHIFRNSTMFDDWKAYEKLSVKDFNLGIMTGKSRGHQEDARRNAVLEFIERIANKNIYIQGSSDFEDHKIGVMLLYGIYRSAINRKLGKDTLVNVNLKS